MSYLIDLVQSRIPLTRSAAEFVARSFETRIIEQPGMIAHAEGDTLVVEKDVLRIFYRGDKYWNMTAHFVVEGDLYTMPRNPSFAIEALQPCTLHIVSQDALDDILLAYPQVYIVLRNALEKHLESRDLWIRDRKILSGRERYLQFLKTYPGLEARIPARHIAEYIGVEQEWLSTIKRAIRERK